MRWRNTGEGNKWRNTGNKAGLMGKNTGGKQKTDLTENKTEMTRPRRNCAIWVAPTKDSYMSI